VRSLSDSRRVRVFNCNDFVPPILWVVLIVQGISLEGISYLLTGPSIPVQAAMTVAATSVISITLYLIAALNHPFSGNLRVTPENLQDELMHWEAAQRSRSASIDQPAS